MQCPICMYSLHQPLYEILGLLFWIFYIGNWTKVNFRHLKEGLKNLSRAWVAPHNTMGPRNEKKAQYWAISPQYWSILVNIGQYWVNIWWILRKTFIIWGAKQVRGWKWHVAINHLLLHRASTQAQETWLQVVFKWVQYSQPLVLFGTKSLKFGTKFESGIPWASTFVSKVGWHYA